MPLNIFVFFSYAKIDGAELIDIPFLDPEVSMAIVLPEEGKGKFE